MGHWIGRKKKKKTLVSEASHEEGVEDGIGSMMRTLVTHKYIEEVVRLVIIEMIIINGLPFRVVEGKGSRKVC